MPEHVGFVGVGRMGDPMVRNLLKAGHEVSVYDLVPAAIASVTPNGAKAAPNAAEAARGSGRSAARSTSLSATRRATRCPTTWPPPRPGPASVPVSGCPRPAGPTASRRRRAGWRVRAWLGASVSRILNMAMMAAYEQPAQEG